MISAEGSPNRSRAALGRIVPGAIALAVAAGVLVAGCSGSGGTARTIGVAPTPAPSVSASPSTAPQAHLFVSSVAANAITTYQLNADGTPGALIGTIAGSMTGLSGPSAVAVDSRGFIYAANESSITVYPANPIGTVNEAPVATIPIALPNCVAVAPNDQIYACEPGTVYVYAAHPSGASDATPIAQVNAVAVAGTQTIPMAELNGVAFDSAGRYYVSNNIQSIFVMPPNPSGVVVGAQPAALITGLGSANDQTGGLHFPYGIGLDASGRIYVANFTLSSGEILVFPADPIGILNEAPVATIAGDQTGGLSSCITCGLAIGPTGVIYVATGAAVLVFPANPTGTLNEAPIATLTVSGGLGVAVH